MGERSMHLPEVGLNSSRLFLHEFLDHTRKGLIRPQIYLQVCLVRASWEPFH